MSGQDGSLLEVRELKLYYTRSRSLFARRSLGVRAVDGVHLSVDPGKTLAVVGESGSGKTTLGRVIVGLLEPTDGHIFYRGQELDYCQRDRREIRRKIQMIFQDSYSSLNPRKTLYQCLSVPIRLYKPDYNKRAVESEILRLLETVDLKPAAQYIYRYPHELSGGQRQRVCILRAMIPEPELVVADEPVSALDVSIRSQILNLLEHFQQELKLSYIFITHDLSIAKIMGDETIVMYCGKVMEYGNIHQIYEKPKHPYTRTFLSAIPNPDPKARRERLILKGDPPSPTQPPAGCRFNTRCPHRFDRCEKEEPALIDLGYGHHVRCHLFA